MSAIVVPRVTFTQDLLLTELSRSYPRLRDQWAKVAFVWAINCTDPSLASRSFKLFQKLHNHYVGQVPLLCASFVSTALMLCVCVGDLFLPFRVSLSQSVVERLALTLFMALRNDERDKVTELFEIFMVHSGLGHTAAVCTANPICVVCCRLVFQLPVARNQTWDEEGWSLLVSLGFTMLTFAHVPYFKLGLRLLIQVSVLLYQFMAVDHLI